MASHVPVTEEDRLEHIDLVRGYALLGVLLVNLYYWFRMPPGRYGLEAHPFPGFWNAAADHLVSVWFAGKSVTLFSMLFAIGLCIQHERVAAKAVPWYGYAFRRLGSMILFGFLHILLIWNGDILHVYALCGLLLLPFLGRSQRTIGIWIVSILGLMALIVLGASVWSLIRHPPPPPAVSERAPMVRQMVADTLAGYTQTSWLAIVRFRLHDYVKAVLPSLAASLPLTFLNFLAGLYLWKQGAVRAPGAHLPLLRRMAAWALGLGLAACVLTDLLRPLMQFLQAHWGWGRLVRPLLILIGVLSPQILAPGIGALLITLWQRPTGRRWLRPLTYVGRMAFTNYITQSLVCTTLFYGFGLGLYNRVSSVWALVIVASIYGLQIPLSRWWLTRFRYGPLEWLWRCLTYGALQPFRRQLQAAPGEPPADSAVAGGAM